MIKLKKCCPGSWAFEGHFQIFLKHGNAGGHPRGQAVGNLGGEGAAGMIKVQTCVAEAVEAVYMKV